MPVQRPSALVRAALVLSNAASAVLLAVVGLEWTLVDWLTPVLFLPLASGVAWAFAATCAFSVAVLVLRFGSHGARAAAPVLVQAVVWLAVTLVPFGRMTLDLDFRWYRGEREQVVALVRSGRLPAGPALVPLPASLAHVSRGGDVEVLAAGEHPAVLFYTFRGILDHYAAFAYSEADRPPEPGDAIPWREVDRLDRHWWWVSR